jgi:hypothetical protein
MLRMAFKSTQKKKKQKTSTYSSAETSAGGVSQFSALERKRW